MDKTLKTYSTVQLPDGRWLARFRYNGETHGSSAKIAAEAEAKRDVLINKVLSDGSLPEAVRRLGISGVPVTVRKYRTVAALCEAFLYAISENPGNFERYGEAPLKPGSVKSYMALLSRHCAARPYATKGGHPTEEGKHFGGLLVAEVKPADVKRLLDDMREQGLCVNTRAKVHALLGQVFQYGVQIGWIKADPNGNYVTAVQATKKPKGKLMRRMDLDADQARMLLDMAQASGNRWAEAVEILVRTGLRRVELLGLQWSKVTLDTDGGDGGWLMVSASLHRQAHTLGGQSRLELATTKTKSSNRPIRLTVEGVAALQRQYERQAAEQQAAGSRWIGGDAGSDDMPIFANVFGGWSETTGFNKGFRAIADAAGFKDMTAHGCRHTFVSLLANQMLRETGRIDWQAIADMGGWADIATVQRVYAHLRQSELDQARRQSWTQAGAVQI